MTEMPRYTDENYRGTTLMGKSPKVTGGAFLTAAEVVAQSRKAIEREIVKVLAKEFDLNLRAIGEAVRNETGEFDYLMLGVHQVYFPKFPATIHVVKPKRGKGQSFSLSRLLRTPEKYSLVGSFLAASEMKLPCRPAMFFGSHPRLGLLVVTDLKMEHDILCFQFSVQTDKEGKTQTSTLVIAEIRRLLQAMRRQELWLPEAR
jgi:hypothetical protein